MASLKCYGCENFRVCHLTEKEIKEELEILHLDLTSQAIEEVIEEVENSFTPYCLEVMH